MTEIDKKVRKIFIARAVLWGIAILATGYWIYWSFALYEMGIHDVYEYAAEFRPIFGWGLAISVGAVCISLILRSVSDKIKGKQKHSEG